MGNIANKKEIVEAWNPPTSVVKSWVLSAGNKIGSVWFVKRSTKEIRRMTFKLHTHSPSFAKSPRKDITKKTNRNVINDANTQITVFDTNLVNRDTGGKIIGRGGYRTIPLELVIRLCINNKVYNIHRYKE